MASPHEAPTGVRGSKQEVLDDQPCIHFDAISFGRGLRRACRHRDHCVVVGLTFLFGFDNVLNLALRLGVPVWVAPLVAPAVDLSILGLLISWAEVGPDLLRALTAASRPTEEESSYDANELQAPFAGEPTVTKRTAPDSSSHEGKPVDTSAGKQTNWPASRMVDGPSV